MKQLFSILKANVVRTRTPITAIFLSLYNHADNGLSDIELVERDTTTFLQSKIRQTDVVFQLSERLRWCIFLSHSGEEEAKAFIRRLYFAVEKKEIPLFQRNDFAFSLSIAEIGNSNVEFDELLLRGQDSLESSLAIGAWHVESIEDFKLREKETVKISILEDNAIFRHVLFTAMENLAIENFHIEIQAFSDGYEFLESKWYESGHTHLLIMNDILPRKNGLEVLYTLRNLPNNKRFVIFMMTKRKSEEDMILAYEQGVDGYLIKPFNIRLFESQVRRTFERLWI